jgi:uncharacterized protein (DUF2141 family)
MKNLLVIFGFLMLGMKLVVFTSSCAQIIAPSGGPRDSLPPKLLNAVPALNTTNFTGRRITLYFDEYVHVEEVQQNLLVSPAPKYNPYIDSKLKSVTIRLRDTLEPNTTYTINLGNSIRDINENNAIQDFSYVFSTGSTIDSLIFQGKVQVAETGKADSTMIVMLYRNLDDTAVQKTKPKFIARVDAKGNFIFRNLSAGDYKVYALRDADGSRTYNSKSELFAFANTKINVSSNVTPITLLAFEEEKERPKATPAEKKLVYNTRVRAQKQDVLSSLNIDFNRPLKDPDLKKILLTDTMNIPVKDVTVSIDSTNKIIKVQTAWQQDASYKLIIPKDFAKDTTGLALAKSDTIRFKTKAETDYGIVRLKFLNYDQSKNPVLQFFQDNVLVASFPLTGDTWKANLFNPGEYEMRILFDDNKNGKWDTGNYSKKQQPEKVYSISQKLSVRENFEKDIDIELPVSSR